ncbi:TfoX/Sxy family protein [Ramlibacter sp.]|uniref:TfoX/Sxy family protein n=1 Tax=Ramlibacter sp. TaxID=1917967 RepID=UPI003D0F84F4
MFGGRGLYVDDVFVAILAGDVLYLKTDDETRERFETAGGCRFEYTRQGTTQVTGYWAPPSDAMDSPALMGPWVRLALDAALRARAGNRKRR